MTARYQKRIEGREVAAEVVGELFPADRDWLAAIGYLKPYDLADCEHGCAGPWELCGGDCTFTCHDPAFA